MIAVEHLDAIAMENWGITPPSSLPTIILTKESFSLIRGYGVSARLCIGIRGDAVVAKAKDSAFSIP